MTAVATPRVNGASLMSYFNRTVRLVGKVISTEAEIVLVETSDGRRAQIVANANVENRAKYEIGNIVEVIGTVTPDGRVNEYNVFSLGRTFDLEAYDKMVTLAYGKFPHLFT
jgi:replication factor A3